MMIVFLRAAYALLIFTMVSLSSGVGQLRAVSVETLPLDSSHAWTMPQWSPDGLSVYFTESGFKGIWVYSTKTRTTEQLSTEPRSGYGYVVAPDGSVELAAARNESNDAGSVLAVEGNKITLTVAGEKIILDPLGNGRYIWPSLSPDGTRIAAYDMERGSFVYDLSAETTIRLGRRDAAVWTHDGKWLVYMDDKDDGHRLLGSEIAFVSPDGKITGRLTSTDSLTEMYPRCSPVEHKVVCSTMEGSIVVITYSDEGR